MNKTIICLIVFILLVSCTSAPTLPTMQDTVTPMLSPTSTLMPEPTITPTITLLDVNDNTPKCLSPVREFGYPLGSEPRFDWPESEILYPPQEWQKIVHVPDSSNLMSIQTSNDESVIWISTNGEVFEYQFSESQLMNGVLKKSTLVTSFVPMIQDTESFIWVLRSSHDDSGPLLKRYNEQNDSFETIDIGLENIDSIEQIEIDSRGTLWLVIYHTLNGFQLISLEPQTMTTKLHLSGYRLYPLFVISENSLFIPVYNFEGFPQNDYDLLQYSIDTDIIINTFNIPQELLEFGNYFNGTLYIPSLFVDSQHRVWLGAHGWLDLSIPDWYQWHFLIPDPVFIDVLDGAGLWRWFEPKIYYQTADGLIWYSVYRGTGWVDPESGTWCVFTSFQSEILADSQGNLWILADEWLYRLEQ